MALVRWERFASGVLEERRAGGLLLASGVLEEGVLMMASGVLEEGVLMMAVEVEAGLVCYPRQP
jgi:hypothetical protein